MIMTMRTNVDQVAKQELTLGGEVNRDFNGSDAKMTMMTNVDQVAKQELTGALIGDWRHQCTRADAYASWSSSSTTRMPSSTTTRECHYHLSGS